MSKKPSGRRLDININNNEIEDDRDMLDYVRMFLTDLQYLNRSEYTIVYYRNELEKFVRKIEAIIGDILKLSDVTADMIKYDYIQRRLNIDKVSPGTVNSGLRALRAFFNWAVEERLLSVSPMKNVELPKHRARPVETFNREQLFAILSQPNPHTFVGLRDLTIMTILLDTGVRVRELCDIKVEDIRWEDRQILIDGKDGDYRLVPLQSKTYRLLKKYVQVRGESFVDWLFITYEDGKMSRDTVRDRISMYGRKAGIKGVRCSPHTFRHTFAKMSVQNGANLFELQKILGHKSLEMVRRYVNLFSTDTQRAHTRFSPINSLNLKF